MRSLRDRVLRDGWPETCVQSLVELDFKSRPFVLDTVVDQDLAFLPLCPAHRLTLESAVPPEPFLAVDGEVVVFHVSLRQPSGRLGKAAYEILEAKN